MKRPVQASWIVAISAVVLIASVASMADSAQETTESAVHVLRQCTRPDRRGQYNIMLGSLRQLKDPQLAPLFSDLANTDHPVLKVHGILGLSEISEDKQIDLVRVAAINDVMIQREIISAAIQNDLMTDEQAVQLIEWPGVDLQLKVLAATKLVEEKKFNHVELLEQAMESDIPGLRYWSGMLLVQLDDARGFDLLYELDQSDSRDRDRTRALLIGQVYDSQFDRLGNWAMKISKEQNIDRQLESWAMRTALRFHAEGSEDLWRSRYQSAIGQAGERRMAIELLYVSPWIDAGMFEPMVDSNDELVKTIARAGMAVANKDQAGQAVSELVDMRHSLCSNWALKWARETENTSDAQQVLQELINSYDREKHNSQLADITRWATKTLFELDADAAVDYLREIISSSKSQGVLRQNMLLGLINCNEDQPNRVVEGLPEFENSHTQAMRLLLIAKHRHDISPQEMKQLQMLVRGGIANLPALRVQAAWVYLRLTDQTRNALAKVLAK